MEVEAARKDGPPEDMDVEMGEGELEISDLSESDGDNNNSPAATAGHAATQAQAQQPPARGGPAAPTSGHAAAHSKEGEEMELLERIEREFAAAKEKMFSERVVEADREVEAARAGTHPVLAAQLAELEDQLSERLAAAERWKKLQTEHAEALLEHERQIAQFELKAERQQLRERMVARAQEKKRRLLDEKQALTLSHETQRAGLRKRKEANTASCAPRKKTNAHPATGIRDAEAQDDLAAISRAVASLSVPVPVGGDVWCERGVLHCFGQELRPGDHISVERADQSGDALPATVLRMDGAELSVRSMRDPTDKQSIPLSVLRARRVRLVPIHIAEPPQ